jgi:hypothetical protein
VKTSFTGKMYNILHKTLMLRISMRNFLVVIQSGIIKMTPLRGT